MTVHLEELGSGIFAGNLQKDVSAAWVGICELGQVVDFGVYYYVERVSRVICCDFLAGEGCGCSGDHGCLEV